MAGEEGLSEVHGRCEGIAPAPWKWIRANADSVAFTIPFQIYRVRNGVELVTVILYGLMGK